MAEYEFTEKLHMPFAAQKAQVTGNNQAAIDKVVSLLGEKAGTTAIYVIKLGHDYTTDKRSAHPAQDKIFY